MSDAIHTIFGHDAWSFLNDPRPLVDLAPPPHSDRFCQHTLTHRCTRVHDAGPKGRGVFATQTIYPGEVVGMFSGHTITTADMAREPLDTYIGTYALQICDNLWTIPLEAHLYRFINNACRGNLWYRSGNTLVANRIIHPNEELSYSYDAGDADYPFTFPCYCGDAECRNAYQAGRWRNENPMQVKPWEWSPFIVQRWREAYIQQQTSSIHVDLATANNHLRTA